MVVVTEHRWRFEPDCVAIDRLSKLEVQESMGCSGPSNRGAEIQGKVDLAMGTIFRGKQLKQLFPVLISTLILR